MKEAIGRVLREYRMKSGLSQDQLVEKTDMSKAFLSEIERGKKEASLTTIFRIAGALNVNAWEIVRDIEKLTGNKGVVSH